MMIYLQKCNLIVVDAISFCLRLLREKCIYLNFKIYGWLFERSQSVFC